MEAKEALRKQRLTNPKKDPQDTPMRRSSLSSSKMFSQLSMSFYDESTIRNNKQVIMDNCLFQLKSNEPSSQIINRSKTKLTKFSSKRRKKPMEEFFLQGEKDEMDFRTTQQSKLVMKDQEEKGRKELVKYGCNKSSNKQKGNSLEKFRKMLLADIIQTRIRTPKVTRKKQTTHAVKKH